MDLPLHYVADFLVQAVRPRRAVRPRQKASSLTLHL